LWQRQTHLEADELFVADASNAGVAKELRVSVQSVKRWHVAWEDAGTHLLHSAA
jgi:transposase